ncbi:MAG: hypothetical protein L0332_05680 [Chloroflexi bacterium]|nr:hypothetical protein [Chloroflexota bacterium]MCI0575050.1 hypothetical protein [Chloroflexota bacterium]MCI0643576.1 hypothetical protein [Chloroflexota bacterium]MCI0726198.1 hypothetical protein [Chloroflexota bacterium]
MRKALYLKSAGPLVLPCLVLLLALTACQALIAPPLPTRAVAAATLALTANTPVPGEVPFTWTPAPAQTTELVEPTSLLGFPTRTPAATAPFPTNTPTRTPTPTPTPTPTRYVWRLPDIPFSNELGPSKLGLHVIRNNDPAIMDFIRRAQPAVVKAVDDLGFLAEVRQVSPRTITIGRVNVDNQSYEGSPEEAARRFVAQHLATYQANPAVDYWEGWNEPDPNYNNMIWFSRFEQERVKEMARYGFRCAIGSFATGVPEFDEFMLFLPAVDAAMRHGGVLSLHEYSAPDMTFGYGAPLPGFPPYTDRGSLTFRYRWLYRDMLEPGGMVIPLVITEAGVDGIIGNRPGPDGLGWWDFQSYWVEQGWGPNGPQAFINQLAWYDAGVRQDGYVIGFTVFTAGGFGYWQNYNINSILPQITDYVIGQR